MLVGRLPLARRHLAHHHVAQRRARPRRQVGQAALLLGLAQGDRQRVALPRVRVPADLHPQPVPRVPAEQDPAPRLIHDQRRGGEVQRQRPAPGVGFRRRETAHPRQVRLLVPSLRPVPVQPSVIHRCILPFAYSPVTCVPESLCYHNVAGDCTELPPAPIPDSMLWVSPTTVQAAALPAGTTPHANRGSGRVTWSISERSSPIGSFTASSSSHLAADGSTTVMISVSSASPRPRRDPEFPNGSRHLTSRNVPHHEFERNCFGNLRNR